MNTSAQMPECIEGWQVQAPLLTDLASYPLYTVHQAENQAWLLWDSERSASPFLMPGRGLERYLPKIAHCLQSPSGTAWIFAPVQGRFLHHFLPLTSWQWFFLFRHLCQLLDLLQSQGWICTRLSPERLLLPAGQNTLILLDLTVLYPQHAVPPMSPESLLSEPESIDVKRLHAFVLGRFVWELLTQRQSKLSDMVRLATSAFLRELPLPWQAPVAELLSTLPESRPGSLRAWWKAWCQPTFFEQSGELLVSGQREAGVFLQQSLWSKAGNLVVLGLLESEAGDDRVLRLAALNRWEAFWQTKLLNDPLAIRPEHWPVLAQQGLRAVQQFLAEQPQYRNAGFSLRGSLLLIGPDHVGVVHIGGQYCAHLASAYHEKSLSKGQPLSLAVPAPEIACWPLITGDWLVLCSQRLFGFYPQPFEAVDPGHALCLQWFHLGGAAI